MEYLTIHTDRDNAVGSHGKSNLVSDFRGVPSLLGINNQLILEKSIGLEVNLVTSLSVFSGFTSKGCGCAH